MSDDDELLKDFFSSQRSASPGKTGAPLALFFGDDDDNADESGEEIKLAQRPPDQSPQVAYAKPPATPPISATMKREQTEETTSRQEAAKRPKIEAQEGPTSSAMSRGPSNTSNSSSEEADGQWDKRFIGTFIIQAWSLSKGSNYVQEGDKVKIERQKPRTPTTQTTKSSGPTAKKQTKLTFVATPANPKKIKVKEDFIVRFSNLRGFEVGRIVTEVSAWMSKLMDRDIAHFEGYVVDCPPSLTVGCDLLLEIRAYLCRSAFPSSISQSVSFSKGQSEARNWRSETAESDEEKRLRERKVSLVKLFRACTLRPSISNEILRTHQANQDLDSEAMMEQYGGENKLLGSADQPQSSGKEIIEVDVVDDMHGERRRSTTPDVDDGTELNDNQLDNVYSKAQLHDPSLPEVEPADGFGLTLRPYQKQALGWMLKMEEKDGRQKRKRSQDQRNGLASREASLHPLWEEYRFPVDEEKMDLLDSGSGTFYFNPYTGHLSLHFQRASRGARGGILADEMGLGKTIQMAALIHTNQPSSEERDSDHENAEDLKDGEVNVHKQAPRQLSLASSFAAAGSSSESSRKAMLKSLASASRGRATLVVAPMSLIGQWRDEMERAIPSMTTMLYYAESKGDLVARLEGGSVDIVITSYGTLITEYKKLADAGGAFAIQHLASTAPLYAVEWLRVILDEAHHIKNKETRNSKACSELLAKRRWCLTGTPIVNRLTDLYSLLRFLRVEPWGDFSFFNSFISKPFANKNPKALEIVQVILESVLIRREKKMKDKDGNSIVDLPPKAFDTVRLRLSPLERKIYDSVYDRAHMQYQSMVAAGTITRNFSFIFSVLMRLRQAVCHPMLVVKGSKRASKNDPDASGVEEISKVEEGLLGEHEEQVKRLVAAYQSGFNSIDGVEQAGDALTTEALEEVLRNQEEENEDQECPFCFEDKSEMCYLPCKHWGCKQCVIEHLQHCEDKSEEATCPTCRAGPISMGNMVSAIRTRPRKNRIAEIVEGTSAEEEEPPPSSQHSQPAVFFRKNDFRSSTKLEALVAHLNQLRFDDPDFKGVIFSQFTSFLDLVEVVLRKNHHCFVRLDGSTSQKDREAVLKDFSAAPRRMLILISLRAGGVGLNLTAANHIWLLDFWWNSSTEEQAIDRVHRLGQTRQVYVHRFLIDESIEDRILAIQARKTALVGAALAGTRGVNEKSEALQNLELLFS